MNELKEIKRRLSILDIRQNGYIKVEDVRSVIDFIDGLIFVKDNKDDRNNNKWTCNIH